MAAAVAIPIVLTVASAAVSAYGAIQAGNAQRAAYNRQAQIDQQNAQVAAQDRVTDIETAQLAQQDKARANTRQLAALRAAYGNSGLELAGSPLDVLTDTSTEMAVDERRIGFEGQVKGRSDALRILGFQDQAASDISAGKNAQSAGYTGALGHLFSGAASAASLGFSGGGGGDNISGGNSISGGNNISGAR